MMRTITITDRQKNYTTEVPIPVVQSATEIHSGSDMCKIAKLPHGYIGLSVDMILDSNNKSRPVHLSDLVDKS